MENDEALAFEGLQKSMEDQEDLNNIFRGLSGFFFDKNEQAFKKIPGVKQKYCADIVNKLMDYTLKALTSITRLSANEKQILAFKSTMSYVDLSVVFGDFGHTCKLDPHCLRSKEAPDFEIEINGLAKVIDDSYRQSREGFMAKLRHRNYNINENIDRKPGQKKRSALSIFGAKIPMKQDEDNVEEEELL